MHAHETKSPQILIFNVTNIEDSVALSCDNPLTLSLLTPRADLERLPPNVQLITNPTEGQDVNKLQAIIPALKAKSSTAISTCVPTARHCVLQGRYDNITS